MWLISGFSFSFSFSSFLFLVIYLHFIAKHILVWNLKLPSHTIKMFYERMEHKSIMVFCHLPKLWASANLHKKCIIFFFVFFLLSYGGWCAVANSVPIKNWWSFVVPLCVFMAFLNAWLLLWYRTHSFSS